ncbi:MAG: hypothetical protein R3C01_15595 [Planctomycetaceae bacterium]
MRLSQMHSKKKAVLILVVCTLALSFGAANESTIAVQQSDQKQCVVIKYSKPVEWSTLL